MRCHVTHDLAAAAKRSVSILQRRYTVARRPRVGSLPIPSCLYSNFAMAQYLSIAVRAFCVGAIIVIIAVVSRQVYLQVAADDGFARPDQEPAATMMMRCEAMHSRLQNRHIAEDAANADEVLPRARCLES